MNQQPKNNKKLNFYSIFEKEIRSYNKGWIALRLFVNAFQKGNIMKLNAYLYSIIILVLFASSASASNTSAPDEGNGCRKITIGDSVRIALQNNLDLKQSANLVDSSSVSVLEREGNFSPSLSASIGINKRYGKNLEESATTQDTSAMSAEIQSSYDFSSLFANVPALNQAKLELDSNSDLLNRQREYVIFETVSRFLNAVMDQELIAIESENLADQRSQLERIEAFYKAGNRPISDVLQQRADIAEAELSLLNADRNFEISKLNLLQIMGIMSETDIELVKPPRQKLIDQFEEQAYETNYEAAFEQRSDYLSRKKQIEAAKKGIKAAQAGYLPSLNLSLSTGSNYAGEYQYLRFPEDYDRESDYSALGLSLYLPIPDTFNNRHKVRQARIQLSDQELELRQKEFEILLENRQAKLDFETAIKQRDTTQAQLQYATEALEVAQARYDRGFITYIELSQIRTSEMRAQNNKVQADYNLIVKSLAVKYYQGTIADEISVFE